MENNLIDSWVLELKFGKTFIEIIDRTNFIYQLKQKGIINNYYFSINTIMKMKVNYKNAPLYDI